MDLLSSGSDRPSTEVLSAIFRLRGMRNISQLHQSRTFSQGRRTPSFLANSSGFANSRDSFWRNSDTALFGRRRNVQEIL